MYLFGLCLIFLFIAGCATVGVNNYQNAETVGKKRFKAGLDWEFSRDMSVGIDIDEGIIKITEDYPSASEFNMPSVGLTAQYGITGSTDIGAAVNVSISSASGKIYFKQNLVHTSGNTAIALLPGVGIYAGGGGSGEPVFFSEPNTEYEKDNSYEGYFFDIPLIISNRWSFFSVHLSPKYTYHRLYISTEYREIRESDGEELVHNAQKKTFDFHTYGVAAGFSFVFKRLELTPEISFLRVNDLPKNSYRWTIYPGLGIFIKFGYKKR